MMPGRRLDFEAMNFSWYFLTTLEVGESRRGYNDGPSVAAFSRPAYCN